MRISDWSSDVCSSDLSCLHQRVIGALRRDRTRFGKGDEREIGPGADGAHPGIAKPADFLFEPGPPPEIVGAAAADERLVGRSEEHTSELQSLMRISYAVFCLKKKTQNTLKHQHIQQRQRNKTDERTIQYT